MDRKLIFRRVLVGVAATVLSTLLLLLQFPPFETLEVKLLDLRFKLRGSLSTPDKVVIAAIDEHSIKELGRWPWDRSVLARLVDKLAAANAGVIAFDIILSEPERNDPVLAKSLQQAGNVILPIVFDFSGKDNPIADPSLQATAFQLLSNEQNFSRFPPIEARGILLPVQPLRSSAMSMAHINMFPDADGTLRWEPLAILYNSMLYPCLGLQSAAAYLGIPADRLAVNAAESVQIGKTVIPTDQWGRTIINYYGPDRTFRHISISDILDGKIAPSLLEDRIVLVGATAVGIYDLRVTPYAAAMPGIEKHASVIASILDKRFVTKTGSPANIAILWVSGLLLSILVARSKLVGDVFITAAALALLGGTGVLLFSRWGIWVNLAYPLNNAIFITVAVTAYNYAVEERHARKIRAMFSSYVTQTIVNELIKNPEMAKLGGEKREITVLFSDIKDFTTFSEHHTPEEVVGLLNEYLTAMTEIILEHEGTLDKFIGDAIVVFWNAPIKTARHAELAVKCALAMQKRVAVLQNNWRSEGKPVLEAGIGINTGAVVVGNIGAEGKKMEYTVIGDQVNLGSRVESQTRKFAAPILITDGTLKALLPAIEAGAMNGIIIQGLANVIVKGRQAPVELHSVALLAEPGLPPVIIPCPEMEPLQLTEK
ncbi:adenylate cyclase 1 [Geobacter sp. OR-1]|uniref:CHASE2 domain-containing protein n=1 Tax=Geobacter sp. OR-1 TaxID=1266765 RepID=UPI0005440D33|nr:adenylate/guanylate cyclase domain-containing protein [Geobacter sp. OR-1]GAM09365.1 adenylate cyclase 1 [Geobacter sp. OR-1]